LGNSEVDKHFWSGPGKLSVKSDPATAVTVALSPQIATPPHGSERHKSRGGFVRY